MVLLPVLPSSSASVLRESQRQSCGRPALDWSDIGEQYFLLMELSCAGVFDCKPLPVLWGRFPEYTAHNTIMFDDLRRNYVFNPQNGLVIRPYK